MPYAFYFYFELLIVISNKVNNIICLVKIINYKKKFSNKIKIALKLENSKFRAKLIKDFRNLTQIKSKAKFDKNSLQVKDLNLKIRLLSSKV